MGSACKIFGHRWNGRICKRCGAIRSAAHMHRFVPMKGECAEECAICGEQRLTEHDWYRPSSPRDRDGRFVEVIGEHDVCRTCGARRCSRVKIGIAQCDASELTPLQRGILQRACERLAKSNMISDQEIKNDLKSIAHRLENKHLYFDLNRLEPVKLAAAFYLSEQSGRLKETKASEEQDRLLLEYLSGLEMVERLNHIKTN